MPSKLRLLGIGVATAVFAMDQISKLLVLHDSSIPEQPLEITYFFNLVLVWNRGVSFGLFAHNAEAARWMLVAVGLGLSAMVAVWLWRSAARLTSVATGLVLGGALGNILDRLLYGAVVDFLDFHLDAWHWPAFNIADSAICVGVCLLIIESFLPKKNPPDHVS
ncbi:MAG: lipoprotein signal peptidase [Alphaproteobacteria bacterium]|nr:lipoprotein signal peptidase [Alphaproteobacteria bacterium]